MTATATNNPATSESSFYVTGGTLRRDAPCYVERRADQALYDGLWQGQFCYVLTSRQMGKSSLMVRTAARLREAGAHVVVLDLTSIGQNLNAEQWYDGLLNRVGQQLGLEDELDDYWEAHLRLGPLQRWVSALREVVLPQRAGRIVIFVDEIDAVRSLPFSTDEFFAGIREFFNRRSEDAELNRLTFCLAGVATPSDLIQDTRTTPFNIGQRIELDDFTEAEAAPLAQGLRRDEKTATKLLKRILYWTNGHPYLTQRLCQAVAEDNSVVNVAGIDRICEEMFFTTRARERDDNLLFVRERLLRGEVDRASLLDLYNQVRRHKRVKDDETNPLLSLLRLSGITRVVEGLLYVRNRIYYRVFDREWVLANLPDAEVQRQRAAFRRGVLRATAVAAVLLTVIGGLALAAIQQRNRATAEAQRADLNFQQASLNAVQARAAATEANQQRQLAEEKRSEAETHRAESNRQTQIAETQRGAAEQQRSEAIVQKSLAEEQRQRAQEQAQMNRRMLYVTQMNLAGQAWEQANLERMAELLNLHLPQPGRPVQEDLRGFEWYLLWNLSHSDLPVLQHNEMVRRLFILPDGNKLLSFGPDAVRLWEIPSGRELAVFKGHERPLIDAALSPDSKLLVTASSDMTAKLWEVATGRELFTFQRPRQPIGSVAFSPDSQRVATTNRLPLSRTPVTLWDVTTGQELVTFQGQEKWVMQAVFSPNGKHVATANNDGSAKVWSAETGKELFTLEKPQTNDNSMPAQVIFSPDGKKLATGLGGTVKLWDATTGKELFTLKVINWGGLAFSPDGRKLATSGFDDHAAKLWDATTGEELFALRGHTSNIGNVAFSPDGLRLATLGRDSITKLWDVVTGQEVTTLKGHANFVAAAAFSPNGRWLATSSGDKTVRLWDVTAKAVPATFDGSLYESVAFTPDGNRLVTGKNDSTSRRAQVKLWDAASGKEIFTLKGLELLSDAALSPDGKTLVTASGDTTMKLWDATTGQERMTIPPHKNWDANMHIRFSRDGKRLVTATTDFTFRMFDVATGKLLTAVRGHTDILGALDISPDGRMLATGSRDRTVKLWDMDTGKALFTFTGHKAVIIALAFSPDGRMLATGGNDRLVKLWDVATKQEILTLKGHSNFISSIAFSPDGRSLATGSMDNTAKLWELATGQELLTLSEHKGPVHVAFSPDGTRLVTSGSGDQMTKLWRAATEAEVLARRGQ